MERIGLREITFSTLHRYLQDALKSATREPFLWIYSKHFEFGIILSEHTSKQV